MLLVTIFNGYTQDSLQYVVAEKGDGILSLLRKQGVNPYDIYDEFISLNIENLRDSVHLYEGRKYAIPVSNPKVVAEPKSVKGISYEIFGKEYAEVESQSNRLEGAVYYLKLIEMKLLILMKKFH